LVGRFCLWAFEFIAPANEKSPGVTEEFWQIAISQALCLPGFFKGVVDE
jgi:hypothetical protein